MKRLLLALILLLPVVARASTTTLTGTIRDAAGNGINGTLELNLAVSATDLDANVLVSNAPVRFRLVNGAITGSASVNDVGSTHMQPAGNYYKATVYDSAGNPVMQGNFVITGATFNMGTAVPTNVTTSNVSYSGIGFLASTNTWTGANAHAGAETFKNIENIVFVDQQNSQGWAGTDYGAWVMSAIASLSTVNGYKSGQVMLAPSTSVVTQSSGVSITSPFVSVTGPGPGALQISCTFNGNCWDVHVSPFVTNPGFILRGFSVIGQGTANANAVGFSFGDVIGGKFEDLAADNFRGANSACFWFNNINGFTERNVFTGLQGGLAQGGQNGCTKDYRWSQPATSATSSFVGNHYIANKYSVGTGQTALSVEGGNHTRTDWFFTGNVFQGTNAIVFALSGLTFTGGTPALVEATNLNISSECTSPCTAGTLLSLAATNNIFIHSGGGFFDNSGLLTSSVSGNLIRYANSRMNAASAQETLRFSGFPVAGLASQYDVFVQNPTAGRTINWLDPGGNDTFTWLVAPQTLTNKTSYFGIASLAAQTGTVPTANLVTTAPIGEYLIQIYMPSTVACATPGPAQVVLTIGWTDETGARTQTFTQALGTTTGLTNTQIPVWVNAAASITYATTLTACTTGTATYALRLSAAKVQ